MRGSWFLGVLVPFVLAAACSDDDGGGGVGGSSGSAGSGFGGVGGSAGSSGGSAGASGGSAGASGGSAGQAGADASSTGGSAGATGGSAGQGGSGGDAGPSDAGPPPVVTPGAADKILLKGTVVAPSGPIAGEVLVEGNSITCVAASCSAQPGASGATVIDTNGIIVPGLIDAHNHGLFNIFDEDDWTPTQKFQNHNQWNSTSQPRYGEVVDAKQYLEGVSTGANVSCEMVKYAETKAIMAATTSFLLAPGAVERQCYGSVARSIDTQHNDLPADKIRTSISVPTETTAQSICDDFTDGTTDAYVVHIAEGIDNTAKNEFTTLASRAGGCLINAKTTIVHGTALTSTEFTTMAQAGMSLVWSPRSNDFLYPAPSTTNIPAAIAAGIQVIALAPDWALGGSINMLDELAFAAAWDDANFGDVLTSKRLFDMVTIDAAKALHVDQYLGSLEVGKRADIAVISQVASDPYDSLIQQRPSQVRLVMLDGRVLYGDKAIEAAAPATPGCEDVDVCSVPKVVCIAENDTSNKLNQTLAQVTSVLQTELTSYDSTVMPAGGPLMPLAPLFKCP